MMLCRILPAALLFSLAPMIPTAAAENDAGHTELEDQMEEINVAYRRLGRQVKDPARNEDSIKRVEIMRKHAQSSMELTPKKAAELPEVERGKFIAAYKEAMTAFIAEIDKLGAALKANDNEAAAKHLAALRQAQEDGHRDFRPKKLTFEEKAAEAARRSEEFQEQIKQK